jgi:hypothetical protein
LLPAGSAWFAFPTVRNWSYTYLENADRSRWDKRCTVYRVTARPTNRRPWGNKRNHPHHHCLIFCTPTKPATHWPQVEESTRKASMEPSCTGVLSQMNVPIVDIGSERSDVLIGAYSYFSLIEEISAWSFYHADVCVARIAHLIAGLTFTSHSRIYRLHSPFLRCIVYLSCTGHCRFTPASNCGNIGDLQGSFPLSHPPESFE